MRKIKEIKVKARKAYTKKVEVIICDFCKLERKCFTCFVCGRQACQGGYLRPAGCMKYDPHEYGDYPDHYCPICYELRFVKYSKAFQDAEVERDMKVEKLEEKIKQESLAIGVSSNQTL